jgi:AbrB family looped-hinge helix DNA binding protein
MAASFTVKIAQRGLITLPQAVREAYHIEPGDVLTLLDLDGVLVLSPRRSEVDLLADRLGDRLRTEGESIESLLQAIREERARYAP